MGIKSSQSKPKTVVTLGWEPNQIITAHTSNMVALGWKPNQTITTLTGCDMVRLGWYRNQTEQNQIMALLRVTFYNARIGISYCTLIISDDILSYIMRYDDQIVQ